MPNYVVEHHRRDRLIALLLSYLQCPHCYVLFLNSEVNKILSESCRLSLTISHFVFCPTFGSTNSCKSGPPPLPAKMSSPPILIPKRRPRTYCPSWSEINRVHPSSTHPARDEKGAYSRPTLNYHHRVVSNT